MAELRRDDEHTAAPPSRPDPGSARRPDQTTIYADLAALLEARGWARARGTRGRLTLDEAVDELLGTGPGAPATGALLARAARVTLHLRELAGAPSLAGWNDDRHRTFDDVRELLEHAALAFPED